jgi:hypothetical protein
MTPAKFNALSEVFDDAEKRSDWQFGMMISTVINMFGGKKQKRVGALEVMGREEGESSKSKIQSPQETMLRFRLFEAAMGRKRREGMQ